MSAAPGVIELVELENEQFEVWRREIVESYARDKVRAGNWPQEGATDRAHEELKQLLPQGMATPDQYFYAIRDPEIGRQVGMLWFADQSRRSRPTAWIFELSIFKPYRRLGYAAQAMLALEEKVKSLGLTRIELHVFGHNRPARALYEKVGYDVINVVMAKELG